NALRITSSGFVSFPRMPDIIRLRVAALTISGNGPLFFQSLHGHACFGLLSTLGPRGLLHQVRFHEARDRGDNRHDNGVTELTIGLRIGHNEAERFVTGLLKPHHTRAFPWRKAARVLALL